MLDKKLLYVKVRFWIENCLTMDKNFVCWGKML